MNLGDPLAATRNNRKIKATMLNNRIKYIWLTGLVLLALSAPRAAMADNPALVKDNFQEYLITYSTEVRNTSELSQEVSIIVPYYETDEFQIISYHNFEGEVRSMPNSDSKYIETIATLAPKEVRTFLYECVAVVYDVTADFSKVKVVPYNKDTELYRRNILPDPPEVDPTHPKIKEISAELAAKANGDVLEYARLANEYVDGYRYSAQTHYYSVDKTIANEKGNCEDLSGFLVSLLRCYGIPARTAVGVTVEGKGHVRAEFYLENYGWFPLEGVSDDYFGIINYKKFSGLFVSQKAGMFQLLSDDHGFLCTKPTGGRLFFNVFAGSKVHAFFKRGFVKLENGEPVGEFRSILNF